MKKAFFDCFSGISGDMCLGALVDAGVSLKQLLGQLKRLPVEGYTLTQKKVLRSGISATKVDVILRRKKNKHLLNIRKWKDIKKIIATAKLPEEIKMKGLNIFKTIFHAESHVHNTPVEDVHLHELGAVDCLIDVFGTLIGLSMLNIETVYSSPINLGCGSVESEHGLLPVPAPATAEIIMQKPVYTTGIPFELTTPTGAAIISNISSGFGEMPCLVPEIIGYGAGDKDFKERPNVLRIFIGKSPSVQMDEKIIVIETNIDDMNPQIYEYVIEKLLNNGALDVFLSNIIMKKTRPGIKLSVLCYKDNLKDMVNIIFNETTSIGIRFYEAGRLIMEREIQDLNTKYGHIRTKISCNGDIIKSMPEYEDCKKIAIKKDIPLIKVMNEAKRRKGYH